ncbi:hybrid sensor histidine kinase/response regulator [Fulvivirga sediminis]|uniref:histidine kinase n=1 Tax=Fulvivirga sediminis TaxID=2803949 RepID=A0A937JY13_9BACT|nr:ATP-binding protein [Fulvivirga sediminis]MBL3656003.1 response regulator [Fulvivirga sediminis]
MEHIQGIETVQSRKILQGLPQEDVEAITSLAKQICGTSLAFITLIEHDNLYILESETRDVTSIPASFAFCHYTLKDKEGVFIVPDASEDCRFKDNPYVTDPERGTKFYAGVTLLSSNGNPMGTLCVLDRDSNQLNDEQTRALKILGRQTMNLFKLRTSKLHLEDALLELTATQGSLRKAKNDAEFKVEKLRFLTHAVNVGLFEKSVVEQIEAWSDELYRMLGHKPGDMEGSIRNLFKKVHPADRGKIKKLIYRSGGQKKVTILELRLKTKSHGYKWFEVAGNIKRDKKGKVQLLIGRVLNIHERKVTENQLKAFIDYSPAAIAMFNKDIEYIAASKKWLSDYLLTEADVMGKTIYDTFTNMDLQYWKEIHRKCLLGHIESNEGEFIEEIVDGKSMWLKWEIRPWYISEDEIGGIMVFTEDITQEKHRNIELKRAKDSAERASKAKAQFLATMSHEIRTPLNAINGLSHLLISENPRPDQLDHLKLLKFSGDNLLSLVNDILDINKIEAGKIILERKAFGLEMLIKNIKDSLIYKAQENLVDLKVDYDPKLPKYFIGDATRMSQIMYNLVGNAIKFTHQAEVKISLELIEKKEEQYNIRVSVKDKGIGISKDKHEKIFKSFEQANEDISKSYGGTGLGLYITRKLLHMMGSEIAVCSEEGEGSEFYFCILLEEGNVLPDKVNYQVGVEYIQAQDIKVLVVEDNTANQILISKFLEKANVGADMANNGEEALVMIESQTYDMILMDLRMPRMDGYKASMLIRKMKGDYYKNVPIIALTADVFSEVQEKVYGAGMTDYLSKPFKPSRLYETLHKYSGRVVRLEPDQLVAGADEKVKNIIHSYGNGDKAFERDFAKRCKKNYMEFVNTFRCTIEKSDLESLNDAIHKIKSLNAVFEQKELQDKLVELSALEDEFVKARALHQEILDHSYNMIAILNSIA